MILDFDTEASYLSKPGSRSHASAYYYMTKRVQKEFKNGAIYVLSTIIKHVMSLASKVETIALYYGCKRTIPYRVTLQEMVHPQTDPTPYTTNNNIEQGLMLGKMNSKASKSKNTRFQWLKFRKAQKLFAFLWARGAKNLSD